MVQLRSTNQKGQSLVEILLAMGLMAVLLPAILTGIVASREGKPQKERRQKATSLVRETQEALRSLREDTWSNISTNGTYYPNISGTEWALTSGSETTSEGFTRQLILSDVQRDLNGAIVTSGGIVDPSTKKADITVSWTTPIPSSIETSLYLSRILNNASWEQTTQAEFTNGTNVNVSVVNNNGGEIELTSSTGGDWTSPTEVDTYDTSGVTDGFSVFTLGNYFYLGSNALYIIDISDPLNLSLVGTYSTGADVYDIYVEGDYAYLATSSNSAELMVVDISTKSSPTLADSLNLNKNNNAYGVFKSGNYAYISRDKTNGADEFYVIDVSNPTNISQTGSLEVGDDANAVQVSGNYAYIATDGTELRVIDISTPASPSFVGSYNAPSGSNGEDLFFEANVIYLVTANNGSGDELYIVDVSTPTSPSLIGSYDAGGATNGVYKSGDLVFVAGEKPSQELQIVDVSTPSSPSLYGFYALNSGINDVTVSGNYAYLGMDDNTREASVIEGGFGGAGSYQASGTYESQTFDAGSEVAFNHITFELTEPASTNVNLQVATNNDNSTWSFIGPDGSSGTYYESPGGISLVNTLGQYLRVKAYLTGDGNDTPVLESFGVNYSP